MATNPYELLGVAKDASQDYIQKAYRKLVKKVHPDRNSGSNKAEEHFKEVASAYSLRGDVDKRKKCDARFPRLLFKRLGVPKAKMISSHMRALDE